MPVRGPAPKPQGQRRRRNLPVHEWLEVENVPYSGPAPRLPRCSRGSWSEATKRWWATGSTMPHCVLWTLSDWQFALDTAAVYEEFAHSPRHLWLLLDREKVLGTTADFRRNLRIRYVEPEEIDDEAAQVALLDHYRRIVGGESER